MSSAPDASRWEQVQRILDAVLDLPPQTRTAEVTAACGEDTALRDEVLELLAHVSAGEERFDTGRLPGLNWAGASAVPPEDPLEGLVAGRRLAGRYQLGRRLAAGGSGVVFAGEDTLTGDALAIKVMRRAGAGALETFRREVGILRTLRLPGVVRLLDEGEVDGHAFIAMERVQGAPFPGVEAGGSWGRCAAVVRRFLEALARVHWAGVVHRDLKPANVLVDAAGFPTILDLGIALPGRTGPRREAGIRGTPAYLAPEQLEGRAASARSDLYAVGVILYEAICQTRPHPLADLEELIARRLNGPEPDWTRLDERAPPPVAAAVRALLRRDPAERPGSVGELLRRLREPEEPGESGEPGEPGEPDLEHRVGATPRDEASLRELFRGPDRLVHLREDAAHELWRRTRGQPDQVVSELRSWLNAGLVRREGELLVVTRPALERLRGGLQVRLPEVAPPGEEPPAGSASLLVAIGVAGLVAEVEVLGATVGLTADACRELLGELLRTGWVGRLPGERHLALRRPAGSEPAGERARLLDALFLHLAAGSPGRLELAVASGDAGRIAAEALCQARSLAAAGQLERASAALSEGLFAARRGGDTELEEALLLELLDAAFELEALAPLEHLLSELARARRTARVEACETLARAALWALRGSPQRALADLERMGPLPLLLERTRWAVMRVAAFKVSPAREEAVLAEALAWAGAQTDPRVLASAAYWRGRALYDQLRFPEAAAEHALCAELCPQAAIRVGARLNGASALLEAAQLEAAAAMAREALREARHLRLGHHEARAEWLLRAVAYRSGAAQAPDEELVDALNEIASPALRALLVLNEGAVAWRAGSRTRARELALQALDVALRLGHAEVGLVAKALALACGARELLAEAPDTAARAAELLPPGLVIQVLALLGEALPQRRGDWAEVARARAEALPRETWEQRRELLSVREALARLAGEREPPTVH